MFRNQNTTTRTLFRNQNTLSKASKSFIKMFILLSLLLSSVVAFHQYFADTLAINTQLPLLVQMMKTSNENESPVFHMVISAGGDNLTMLNMRSMESVFYHHKKAKLIIHSNRETGLVSGIQHPRLQSLIQLGYEIQVQEYMPSEILRKTAELPNSHVNKTIVQTFADQIEDGSLDKGRFWYANEANMIRLCVLYLQGGIYLDTDVVLINKVLGGSDALDSVVARHSDGNAFHNSVLKFNKPNNPFLAEVLHNMIRKYNGNIWGYNGVRAFARAAKAHPRLVCPPRPLNIAEELQRMEAPPNLTFIDSSNDDNDCWIHPLPNDATAPISWRDWDEYCFQDNSPPYQDVQKRLLTNSLLLHFNNKNLGGKIAAHSFKPGTICDHVLHNYCITCQD